MAHAQVNIIGDMLKVRTSSNRLVEQIDPSLLVAVLQNKCSNEARDSSIRKLFPCISMTRMDLNWWSLHLKVESKEKAMIRNAIFGSSGGRKN